MKKLMATGLMLMLLTACTGDPAKVTKEAEPAENPKEKTGIKDSTGNEEQENHGDKIEMEESVEVVQEPQYKINENNWSIEPIAGQNAKVVLLTIDDAPDKHGMKMAENLKEMDAPAIFFVNGHFLDTPEEKETLKKIHEMGFMIGNHTYNHRSLPDLSPEEQKEEIISLNELVESITGERPKFFRAPFGQNTDYSRQIAAEEKMALMNWTYGYDWNKEYKTKETITEIMVNNPYLNDGANLLMHDRAWTSEALPGIVKGLREKGYETLDPAKIKTP
jgi:peptidoglycan-N-acetylglucosamine deacetylase